jgi:GNAT superfamily N-acetyltransferase
LPPRVLYAAIVNDQIISFIAGHLSQRLNCDGELQWLDTVDEFRNRGIASQLVRILAKWFIDQKAYKICVDPGTDLSRQFYQKNGATDLNQAWMYWKDIRKIV